jgi:hypothetical protein
MRASAKQKNNSCFIASATARHNRWSSQFINGIQPVGTQAKHIPEALRFLAGKL